MLSVLKSLSDICTVGSSSAVVYIDGSCGTSLSAVVPLLSEVRVPVYSSWMAGDFDVATLCRSVTVWLPTGTEVGLLASSADEPESIYVEVSVDWLSFS